MTERMKQNAQKFAYLVKAYPEKTVPEVIALLQMGPIDINTAIWAAVDLGYVTDIDKKDQRSRVAKLPKTWDFGQDEADLEAALLYAFGKLSEQEKDLEENYLSNWVAGYAAQDSLIAVKRLLEQDLLHEYEIEDGENKYIFYTLKAHAGKNWGQKQFKTNPLTGKANSETETAADDLPGEE